MALSDKTPFPILQTTSHPTVWSWVPFFWPKLAVLESGRVLCCSPPKVEMGVSKIREHSDPPQTKRLCRPYRVHVTFHRQWDWVESTLRGDGVPSLTEPCEALSSASIGQDPFICQSSTARIHKCKSRWMPLLPQATGNHFNLHWLVLFGTSNCRPDWIWNQIEVSCALFFEDYFLMRLYEVGRPPLNVGVTFWWQHRLRNARRKVCF